MRPVVVAIACPLAFLGGLLLGWVAPSVWDSPGLDPCHAAVHRSFEQLVQR